MEYAGYIPVEGIDISGLTDKIANKVFTIGEERKKKKAEIEDKFQAGLTKVSSIKMTENATINSKIQDVAEDYKEKYYEIHRAVLSGIRPHSDLTRFLQTSSDAIDILQNQANTLDARIKEQAQRIEKGEAGAMQGHLLAKLEDMVKLSNTWRVDETGRTVVDVLDDEGNVTQTVSVDYFNTPGMFTSNKIDANAKVDDIMKNWDAQGMYERLARDGSVTWESIRANSAYKTARKTAALALISGDNLQSVLLDNGALPGAVVAYSQSDAKNKISQQIAMESEALGRQLTDEEISEIQDKVIMLDENGKAIISDKQREMAIKAIEDMIDIRAAEKTNLNVEKGYTPQKTSSSDRATDKENTLADEGYKTIVRAMNAPENEQSAFTALENYAKANGREIKVYKKGGKLWIQDVQRGAAPKYSFTEWKAKVATPEQLKGDTKMRMANYDVWASKPENLTGDKLIGDPVPVERGIDAASLVFGKTQAEAARLYEIGRGLAPDYHAQQKQYRETYYYKMKNNKKTPLSFDKWIEAGMPSGDGSSGTTTGTTNNSQPKFN